MSLFKILLSVRNSFLRKIVIYKKVPDVSQQKMYFQRLGIPKDNIQRSFFQSKCQNMLVGGKLYRAGYLVLNILSFPFLIFLLVKPYKEDKGLLLEEYDAFAFIHKRHVNKVVESIKNEFQAIYYVDENEKVSLSHSDKKYILSIWRRYPFSFVFIIKNALKIGIYGKYVKADNIKVAITASGEFAYTASILTDYCEKHGVEHINVMHGTLHYTIDIAFGWFHRFYVWDEYFIDVLNMLNVRVNQYIVEKAEFLNLATTYSQKVKYKYFLSVETESSLRQIYSTLIKLDDNFVVRPHPLWENMEVMIKIFGEERVESFKSKGIEESIMESEFVIAISSTVLYQAWINGKKVVINDISDPKKFKELKSSNHIMLQKSHLLLSEILKG